MRWIFLFLVIGGVVAFGNWSYHLLDNVFLVSDYWQTTSSIEKWGLVNFQGEKPTVYAMQTANGYWPIFKMLWPVWGLIALIMLCLCPLSMYLYKTAYNHRITIAEEAQTEAEHNARKREIKAQEYEQKIKAQADKQIRDAYEVQLKKVNAKLESNWNGYHIEKNRLIEREKEIAKREHTINQRERTAEERVIQIQNEYKTELARFEADKKAYTERKNNAVAAMLRRQNRG